MKTLVKDVGDFHKRMNCFVSPVPADLSIDLAAMRLNLLEEEMDEYTTAVCANDLTEVFDALLDIIYIAVGTGLAYGLPMADGWNEVHRSNMAKLHNGVAVKRADGKILKPKGWVGPQLKALIRDEQKRHKTIVAKGIKGK